MLRISPPASRPGPTLHGPAHASRRRGARTGLALAALVSLAGLVSSLAAPGGAHATTMYPTWPYRPKECTLIRRGATFHLFYTRGLYGAPFDSTWRDIGHAISTDLMNWTDLTPVLAYRPGKWDNFQIWAPSVFRKDSTYYMFYTGLTQSPPAYDHHQRIGLATSNDLYNWTRLDQPVFDCSQVPWSYCDPTHGGAEGFRDPYVMADPDSAGHWLMFYTTRPAAAPGDFIIGVARSHGDLTQWFDGGPLWNTFITHTGSSVVETPDLIQHGGLWYLLYTTWLGHPIWYQTATTPIADSTRWSPQRSLYGEVVGTDTDPCFGPEHYSVDGHDLYEMPDSRYNVIQILEYAWKTPPHFDLVEPYTTFGVAGAGDGGPPGGLDVHVVGSQAPVRLVLDLPTDGPTRLWLCDVTGRRVRRLIDEVGHAGRTERSWDGRDDRGGAAPAGIYFAVIEHASRRSSARFALLR
ncbi:MAG: family 43 glycosylhydrolase [Candidatus Eisenbacteria bacterium]